MTTSCSAINWGHVMDVVQATSAALIILILFAEFLIEALGLRKGGKQ